MPEAVIPIIWAGTGHRSYVMSAGNVVISERAARRIGEILKTEGDGAMLRISVEGGGCSGFPYKFDIERAKADDDLVIARDSAVGVVDPASVPFLAGGVWGSRRDGGAGPGRAVRDRGPAAGCGGLHPLGRGGGRQGVGPLCGGG